MASNAARGAWQSRQTIFFPSEDLWDDGAPESAEDPLTEAAEENSVQAPTEPLPERPAPPAEGNSPEAAEPENEASSTARFNWIREVHLPGRFTVFRAEEAKTGRLVTVELLSPQAAADPEQVTLFYLEAEAAARLRHPHIAPAQPAEPFATTHQRIAGHLSGSASLRELLGQEGWFEPRRALRVVAQVAGALTCAHEAGVLHLQLQPEQIWLDNEDHVLVTGFGVPEKPQYEWARALRAGWCVPPYLSPEQLDGGAGDRASDLYALGVIFYEMLTDRVPFDSNDLNKLRRLHKVKAPRPPQEFNHELSSEHSELVMGLLSRDPQARIRLFREAGSETELRRMMDAPAATPKPARPASGQRLTNPMPLGELAAEVTASSAAPVTRSAADGLARFKSHPDPLPPALPRRPKRLSQSAVLLVSLVGLLGFVLFWLTLNIGERRAHPMQNSELGGAAHLPPTASETSPTSADGSLANSSSPAEAQRQSNLGTSGAPQTQSGGNADDNMIVTPPATSRTKRPTSAEAMSADEPVEGDRVAFGQPVKRVGPVYPASALNRRLSGSALVIVSISESGEVTQARFVSGPEAFRDSAVSAARQWRFTPTKLNGAPVRVHRMITFHYAPPDKLNKPRREASHPAKTRARTGSRGQQAAPRRSGNKVLRPFRSVVRKFSN